MTKLLNSGTRARMAAAFGPVAPWARRPYRTPSPGVCIREAAPPAASRADLSASPTKQLLPRRLLDQFQRLLDQDRAGLFAQRRARDVLVAGETVEVHL